MVNNHREILHVLIDKVLSDNKGFIKNEDEGL